MKRILVLFTAIFALIGTVAVADGPAVDIFYVPLSGDTAVYSPTQYYGTGHFEAPLPWTPVTVKNLDPLPDRGARGVKIEWQYGERCYMTRNSLVRAIGVNDEQILVEVVSNDVESILDNLLLDTRAMCCAGVLFYIDADAFRTMRSQWLAIVAGRDADAAEAAKYQQRINDEKATIRKLLLERRK